MPRALETTELTIANVTEPAVRRRQAAVACSACAPIREQWPHDFASAPLPRAESNAQASAAERQQKRKRWTRATGEAKYQMLRRAWYTGKKLLSRPNAWAKRPLPQWV